MINFTTLHDEFPLTNDLIYLNHAGTSPWPKRTTEIIQRFANENIHQGGKNYPQWEQQENHLREQLRDLLNAPNADDIALLKNTSEAISVVAYGLPWQVGENVVISDQEFPSNRIAWESLQNQWVELRKAKLSQAQTPEAALFDLVDEKTRVIAISAVQYATGLRMDLNKIGEFCQQHQILFCIDAIQALGAVQFDVQANQADFVMADGHKWMLAPEGVAVFYSKPAAREKLELKQYGWHMTEHPHDFDAPTWQIATTARRFECGSPNMLGIHAFSASLSLFAEVGMSAVEAQVLDNTRYLLETLTRSPAIEIFSPQTTDRYAGIVTFRHREKDNSSLFKALKQQKVICSLRGGGIRLSPHFYTPREQLEQAVELILNK